MKQNEQIGGDAFYWFQASLKQQRSAKLGRPGGLWGKQKRLTESAALRAGGESGNRRWRNNVPKKSLMWRFGSPRASCCPPPPRSPSPC